MAYRSTALACCWCFLRVNYWAVAAHRVCCCDALMAIPGIRSMTNVEESTSLPVFIEAASGLSVGFARRGSRVSSARPIMRIIVHGLPVTGLGIDEQPPRPQAFPDYRFT